MHLDFCPQWGVGINNYGCRTVSSAAFRPVAWKEFVVDRGELLFIG